MRAARGFIDDYLVCARLPVARRLAAVAFLVDFSFAFVFLVALPSFLPHAQVWGRYLPALCLGTYGAGKLLSQQAAGSVVDRLGRGAGMRTGLVLITGAQLSLLFAPAAPWAALVAAAIYGAGSATFWPSFYAGAAAEIGEQQRGRLTAVLTIGTGAGLAAALLLGVALPGGFPFSLSIAATSAALLVALVVSPSGKVSEPGTPRTGESAFAAGAFLSSRLLATGAVVFFQSAAVASLLSLHRSYAGDALGLTLRQEFAGLSPAAATLAVGVLVSGAAARHRKRSALLSLALLIASAAVVGLALTDGSLSALALASLAGLGLGLAIPSTTALSLDAASLLRKSGTLLGGLLTLEGLGHAVGPLGVGLIASPRPALAFTAALLACGAVAAAVLARVRSPEADKRYVANRLEHLAGEAS